MRNIIAVIAKKGGVGKSTTAATLAAVFAENGRRVLLIDFDAQASTSAWFAPTTEGPGLFEALTGTRPISVCVRPTRIERVSIITADPRIAGLDRALVDEVGPERIFAERLADLPADVADVVIVDSPPALGLASLSILAAASHALVVTTPDALGGAGLRDSVALVESARKRLNRRLSLVGILACRADHRRNLTAESIEAMRKEYGAAMLAAVIPESAAAAESPSHGQPLTTYDPGGKATEAYRAAAAEIIKRMKGRR